MKQNPTSRSGLFNPRILCAFVLCSVGVLLAMLSLAATTPAETPSANSSVPPDPANFLSTYGSNANRLPPGVPLPPSGLDAPPGRKPLRPGTASGANSLGNPVFANQQPAASKSMPLAPAAAGSWSIVASPNTSATQNNFLWSVTCVSASDCWAVGYYDTGSVAQTLIEHWDGTSWTIVTSPKPSTLSNVLYGVTCTSASECWAVGNYVGSSGNQTLIERWNGSAWAIVTSPNNTSATQTNNYLNGVTCVSASECWAVGYYYNSITTTPQTLIERWNGTLWAIVPSPNTLPTSNNILQAVTCASASDCWAVGWSYIAISRGYQTLIEQWNGASWAIVTSPNTLATQNNVLFSVTCASASDCWAVGYYVGSSVQTLIEQWNGTSWAIVMSANTSATQANFLYGVTCASASECWAVGNYKNGSVFQTLIEQWNGASWAIISPNTSATQNNALYGVTCASASNCWAVGPPYVGFDVVAQTLTEHYTVPVQLVSVVSELTHGSAGTFDIDLPLTGTRGVECRSSASLGAGNYMLVFSFANPVTNCGAASTGSLSSGPNPNQCTVSLTGVANQQYITVTLNNVLDSQNNTGNVAATMGVLVGDVNSTGLVDGNDVSAVQGQARQSANSTNFRLDVNTTGLIDGNDVSLVQSKTRSSLP